MKDKSGEDGSELVAKREGNRKTAAIFVRLTKEERDRLLSLAEQLGITTSELVRRSFAAYALGKLNYRRRAARKAAL